MLIKEFATTTARLAYTWDLADIGRWYIRDLENGRNYEVLTAGSGAGTMVPYGQTQYGYVHFKLNDFREVDGAADLDVGAITANGGILASDTTPILLGNAAESQVISWAASNVDAIAAQCRLPDDFDGSRACTMLAHTYSAGTTNAGSLSVNTYWDHGTVITDTITGAATTTNTEYSGTIAAADMPDAPTLLTLSIVPATHGTDAVSLSSFSLKYFRK